MTRPEPEQEIERSAALIERLLEDRELRARFRADAAAVLDEHGLRSLSDGLDRGERGLMTLELRESRSSLAGAMVAAAAEGVDLGHVAERAIPALERDVGHAIHRLIHSLGHHAGHHVARLAKPAKPDLSSGTIPRLAPRTPPLQQAQPVAPAQPAATASPAQAPASSPPVASAPAAPQQIAVQQGASEAVAANPSAGVAQPQAPELPQTPPATAQPEPQPSQATAPQPEPQPSQATAPQPEPQRSPAPAAPLPEPSAVPAAPQPALPPYPGDAASPQQIAAWMGAAAQRAGLPPELPVMASLTESGMHNLPYGDRDSVGFFQMRLSVWDNGQYSGYPSDPELQLEWFINHALAVQQQYPELAQSPDAWGQWIADVEQPAAQYRYRYQLQLDEARSLLAGANLQPSTQAPAAAAPTTTDPSAAAPTPADPAAAPATADPTAATPAPGTEAVATAAAVPTPAPVQVPVSDEALQVAMRYLGTPYHWGGSTPATGFDCSGLVQYAYAQEGIVLPRVAAEQFDVGIPVPRDQLRPGDAVFFADPNGYVHHVGLYVGDGRFINAPETGEDVRISSLSDPYFAEQYAGARRYTAAALADPTKFARTIRTIAPS